MNISYRLLTWDFWAMYFAIIVFWNYSPLPQSWSQKTVSMPVLDSSTTSLSCASSRSSSNTSAILFSSLTLSIQGLVALFWWLLKNLIHSLFVTRSFQTKTIDERLEPNYNKCLIDVCAGFIEYCIETSNSLDILCRHWAPIQDLRGDQGVPSWILSLEGHAFGLPKENYLYCSRLNGDSFVGAERGIYRASGKLSPSYKFGKTRARPPAPKEFSKAVPGEYAEPSETPEDLPQMFDGTLSVRGIQLGIIEDFASWSGGIIKTNHLSILGWSTDITASDSRVDQFWRTLVANRGPDGGPVKSWYRRACYECLELHKDVPYFNINSVKDLNKTPEGMIEFIDRIRQVVWERTCFRTTDTNGGRSLVGLGPNKARENDLICILFGCSVPVVLREIRGTNEYKFIGECYVDGMMDGEAIEQMSNFESKWFKLR